MRQWLVVAASVAAAFAAPANAQTKVLFNTFAPPTHMMNQRVFPVWIKNVEAATQGRVKIETAPSSLAPPPGQLDLVLKGGADMAWQFSGVVPNRLAMNQITQVPSPTASAEIMSRAIWRTHQKHFGPAGEYKGLKLLALFTFPANHFYSLRDQVTSVDQIRQMKVLTVPGSDAKAWGNLTSGVVTSPVVRYFELVSKGTVDAYTSMPIADILSLNLSKNTRYIIDLKEMKNAATFALFMNERKWNEIGPADQAAIESVSGETFTGLMKAVDAVTVEVIRTVTAEGLRVVVAPDAVIEAVKKAYASVEDEWIAEAKKRGVDGRGALEFYRSQVTSQAR
jgi:TRAP-type C4-dicarboxylate transport system substrate-binding protein